MSGNPPIIDKLTACIVEMEDFRKLLLGFRVPKDQAERVVVLRAYAGFYETCCDCGDQYPRGELILGHVYCARCRRAEKSREAARKQEGLKL